MLICLCVGAEGEFQLWTVLSTSQREGRQVPGRGATPGRLPLQRTRRIPRGMPTSLTV